MELSYSAHFISSFQAQVQTSSRFRLKRKQNLTRGACLFDSIGDQNVGCDIKIDVIF
jgi:hypothetical protein